MNKKDNVFMSMVYLIASLSKDESTHIGAIVVGQDNEIRSVGYNSFPRGINDNVSERQERPEKYHWFAHAEANCVANAALCGVSLKGCGMYTNGIPCTTCVHMIINSGISEVIVDRKWNDNNYNQWVEQAERTKIMFAEAGIRLKFWEGELLQIHRFRNGEVL